MRPQTVCNSSVSHVSNVPTEGAEKNIRDGRTWVIGCPLFARYTWQDIKISHELQRLVMGRGGYRMDFLTIDQAAALMGRTPHAVYRLVARRQIPFRKHGRRLLFKRSELLAFLDKLPGLSLEEAEHGVGSR